MNGGKNSHFSSIDACLPEQVVNQIRLFKDGKIFAVDTTSGTTVQVKTELLVTFILRVIKCNFLTTSPPYLNRIIIFYLIYVPFNYILDLFFSFT